MLLTVLDTGEGMWAVQLFLSDSIGWAAEHLIYTCLGLLARAWMSRVKMACFDVTKWYVTLLVFIGVSPTKYISTL
jgi:hypothetical protein